MVTSEEAKKCASAKECKYLEVSAKKNIGVQELFAEIAKDLTRSVASTSSAEKQNEPAILNSVNSKETKSKITNCQSLHRRSDNEADN